MLESLPKLRLGGRIVVWIVGLIALLSIATGILAILTGPTLEAGGPWGTLQSVAEFSGTVLGFVLLTTAWGMYRGYRIAYVAAAVLVALAAVHGLAQSRWLSVPLIVVSAGGFAVLVLTSDRFTRPTAIAPTQIGAMVAVVGVFGYGTAGAYALRAEFAELDSVLDAAYFAVVTASTVGYGDVHPLTEGARLFAVSLVVLGPTTVGLTVGSLLGPALEKRLSRTGQHVRRTDGSEADSDRIVVLGYDAITDALLDGLENHASVTVVSDEESVEASLEGRSIAVVSGDPTDETSLREADVDAAAAVLVASADECRNGYAVLLARELTDARIVVCSASGNAAALERAGADLVVDPGTLVATALVGDPFADHPSASASAHSG